MSPTRQIPLISKLRERAKNPGVWLFALVFSASVSFISCSSSRTSYRYSGDTFLPTLKVTRQFGAFIDADAISIDAFGNIYILDRGSPGIYKFNAKGDSIASIIGFGKDHNQFDDPTDIDASLTNAVAVADRNNHRIEIYSKDLIWQASIPGHETGSNIHFGYPEAVRAAPAGNYFIIDGENRRALSINPANGSQQVITLSGSESGIALNPVALTLSDNEYLSIADANSQSLITFNNAYLPQSRIHSLSLDDAKLFSAENVIYTIDQKALIIRVFNTTDNTFSSLYELPSGVNHAVAIFVYKKEFYLLTKEKVIVCSKD
jgi:hypothetical protein